MTASESVAEALALELRAVEIGCRSAADQVTFSDWAPTVVIVPQAVTERRGRGVILHADVTLQFNKERSDSALSTCCTGVGPDETAAIQDAARNWVMTEAPPLLSVLAERPILDADWLPDGDPLGIPRWDVFTGPYVTRADDDVNQALALALQAAPLIGTMRPLLSVRLKRPPIFHHVRLFYSLLDGEIVRQCHVDGELDQELGQQITVPPLGARWFMVRQALFAMAPAT